MPSWMIGVFVEMEMDGRLGGVSGIAAQTENLPRRPRSPGSTRMLPCLKWASTDRGGDDAR